MTIALEIDIERNLVVRTVPEPVTFEEFTDAIQEHLNHPDFRRGMRVLWDIRKVETNQWPLEAKRELVTRVTSLIEKRGEGRTGIVASGALMYGLSRQYQILGDNTAPEVGVFKTMEEALEWILAP